MKNDKKNITVAVGMSGGVDSSVAAALLLKEGYSVIGITMKTYDYMEVGGNTVSETSCCDMQAVLDAREVADRLGFPHYVVNMREEFDKDVIGNFINEYMKGRTPNPCVICNRKIKFGRMFDEARKFGADCLATGHYACVRYDDNLKRYVLSKGKYLEKDQSYMLWSVTQESLSKSVFPLGEMTKPDVRKIAIELGLANAKKHESYEICFVPDNKYDRFLKERIPDLEAKVTGGDILIQGKTVGKHAGYPFYTIGQRRNIGAYGNKMYVTNINSENNTIEIGPDKDLHHKSLVAGQINWGKITSLKESLKVQVKVRYKDEGTEAVAENDRNGKIKMTFKIAKRAITPGQSVVVYDKEEILFGGVIETVSD